MFDRSNKCALCKTTGRPANFNRLIPGRKTAFHFLSLPVAVRDRLSNHIVRSSGGRSSVEVTVECSFDTLSLPVAVCDRWSTGRIPVGTIFYILSPPVAVCDRLRMVASRSCVHHWPDVIRWNTCRGFSNRSTGFVSPVVNPVDTRPRQLLSSFFSKCFVWNFSCWRTTPHTVSPPNASYQSENTYVR